MDLESWRLPAVVVWSAWLLAFPLLVVTVAGVGGAGLRRALSSHRAPACALVVLVLWQMRVAVEPAPAVHLLGAAFLTLVLGPRIALVALLAVLCASALDGAGGWASLALNWLLMAALPVAVTTLVLRGAERRLPRNPFVYIFVCSFAAGALSIAAVGLASGLLLVAGTSLDVATVATSHWTSYLLLLFPEAFLTGSTLAWMTMFYPQWVETYVEGAPQSG